MILIALAGLCLLSVPLTGGRLGRLAELRLRARWLPLVALALQVVIVTILPGGNRGVHELVHLASYALLVGFLIVNRAVPGVSLAGLGMLLNFTVIAINHGVMPASVTAERLSGLHLGAGFHNSMPIAHPLLLWLGDVIPYPGPLPNVLSVGDCLVFAGTLILLHRVCGRRRREPLALRPPDDALAPPHRAFAPALED